MSKQQHILMVLTSCDRIDARHPTGLWLEEFAVPYNEFLKTGFKVTIASPLGGEIPIDSRSIAGGIPGIWQSAVTALKNSVKLSSVNAGELDAVVLPGGHGPMVDLATDAVLAALLQQMAQQDKIIAAVCHGPAGLVTATRGDGRPLVAGKKVTGFSNAEERAGQLDSVVPFLLEDRLTELGAEYSSAALWTEYVVRDGKLITGQNPKSSEAFARTIIAALTE